MRLIKNIVHSPSFHTLGIFAGGNLFVAVLGGLGGLLQARWIAPEVFGEFRKYGILTSYFYIGLILVHDGLTRQYPYLIGKGDKAEALEVASAAKWWYLLISWSFTFFFACLLLSSLFRRDFRAVVGWGAQIPAVWIAMFGGYLGVMYRTSSDFKRLSYNNVLSSIIAFLALIFVKAWAYWGLAARLIVQNLASLFINRHYVPVKVKAVYDLKRLVSLSKISLPLSVPGYIQTACLSASVSVIILKYCGQSALGIYGVALTLQGMAMTFAAALNQIFTTKMTSKFGATENVIACLKYARRPTLLSVAVATGMALGLALAIGPFIHLLLPKYVAAIPIIRILAISLPLSAASLPLIVLRSALMYKSVISLAATQFGVCLTAIAILPKSVEMIAASVIFGHFCSLIVGFGILARFAKNGKYL